MEEKSKIIPPSSSADEVLDVKPLRSLAPMFPAPLGVSTFSVPGTRLFVCVPPISQHPSGEGGQSSFSQASPSSAPTEVHNLRPVDTVFKPSSNVAANAGVFPDANTDQHAASFSPSSQTPPPVFISLDDDESDGSSLASGQKMKQPVPLNSCSMVNSDTVGSDVKNVAKRKQRSRKADGTNMTLLPASSGEDPRETVEAVLMTFDALRRWQMDDAANSGKRPDMKATATLMKNELRANKCKRIGSVPGVEVGDIFYFRAEICLVGLHFQIMGGIDYMTAKFEDGEDTVAVSIVSAGVYENEDDDIDTLIYSGQGGGLGKQHDRKQVDDQKLERGNLALERSLRRGNQIRVIRSANMVNVRIYVYDGLYRIQTSWMEKSKSGYNVFKYKLLREPDQPDGMAIWKMTQKWIENPSTRGSVILPDISSGIENVPVCLVNDADDEKGPSHFTYVTTIKHSRPVSLLKLKGCMCLDGCHPGDASCSCARKNGGSLPYSSTGLLVKWKSQIYECNDSCQCSISCQNRLTQKGIRLHFEVFRTGDRGWGLRSWDPIRAGTFICEYIGEVIDKIEVVDDEDEDEYVFETTHADENSFKWNYGPELLGEQNPNNSNEITMQLPKIRVSAKKMGNISRFMNHSCSPNVFWQLVQHDHNDEGYPHIMFFAIKHIPPMTELTYDYGFSGSESYCGSSSQRAKKCLCGSSKCRGLFGKH